jgi:transcriptional regulator with GAF, ATPase, and Fis domain
LLRFTLAQINDLRPPGEALLKNLAVVAITECRESPWCQSTTQFRSDWSAVWLWPGNVRELQNLIERSVILSTSAVLTGSLPEPSHSRPAGSKWSKTSMPVTLVDGQISHILQTLEETKGVIGGRNGAAVRLGLARTTLLYRMKRLGIRAWPFIAAKESLR